MVVFFLFCFLKSHEATKFSSAAQLKYWQDVNGLNDQAGRFSSAVSVHRSLKSRVWKTLSQVMAQAERFTDWQAIDQYSSCRGQMKHYELVETELSEHSPNIHTGNEQESKPSALTQWFFFCVKAETKTSMRDCKWHVWSFRLTHEIIAQTSQSSVLNSKGNSVCCFSHPGCKVHRPHQIFSFDP